MTQILLFVARVSRQTASDVLLQAILITVNETDLVTFYHRRLVVMSSQQLKMR